MRYTLNSNPVVVSRADFKPREVEYAQVSWEEFREAYGEDLAVMYEWFNEVGYEADIGALREQYPDLTTFEEYLRKHGWDSTLEKQELSNTSHTN